MTLPLVVTDNATVAQGSPLLGSELNAGSPAPVRSAKSGTTVSKRPLAVRSLPLCDFDKFLVGVDTVSGSWRSHSSIRNLQLSYRTDKHFARPEAKIGFVRQRMAILDRSCVSA